MGGEGSGMPNAALIKLDGTQIDKDGRITKSNFFDFLDIPLGNYSNIEKETKIRDNIKIKNQYRFGNFEFNIVNLDTFAPQAFQAETFWIIRDI